VDGLALPVDAHLHERARLSVPQVTDLDHLADVHPGDSDR